MKISSKGRYATRAMLDLALHYGEKPIMARDIARRQEFSSRYLEHLLISLKVAGLVRSARGTRGGFVLARAPSQIRLSEIIRAVEGPIAPVACVDYPDSYSRAASCAARDVWVEVKRAVDNVLDSITLQELAERQLRKEQAAETQAGCEAST